MSELPYLRVTGHAAVKRALAHALRSGRLGQPLLLYGPRGVGKQRLALWFAALAHCERAGEEPCGDCAACHLAGRLTHPDVHWFFPTERPRASSPEKIRAKIEEARAEELEERRRNPHYTRADRGPVGIYLAAAQNLRALICVRPAIARQSVTIVGDAETLVPQEASPEAANALLKVFEEPPATSRILLTSSVPGALLPTIRSRCLALRVPPLPQDDVARFLEELGRPPREALRLARRSQGSIGRALELLDEEAQRNQKEAEGLLEAARAPLPAQRLEAAHHFTPFGARGNFLQVLDELQTLLRDQLAVGVRSAGGAHPEAKPEPLPQRMRGLAAAVLAVDDARGMAERNVNPQLIVAGLLARLNIVLPGSDDRGPRLETSGGHTSSPGGSRWAEQKRSS